VPSLVPLLFQARVPMHPLLMIYTYSHLLIQLRHQSLVDRVAKLSMILSRRIHKNLASRRVKSLLSPTRSMRIGSKAQWTARQAFSPAIMFKCSYQSGSVKPNTIKTHKWLKLWEEVDRLVTFQWALKQYRHKAAKFQTPTLVYQMIGSTCRKASNTSLEVNSLKRNNTVPVHYHHYLLFSLFLYLEFRTLQYNPGDYTIRFLFRHHRKKNHSHHYADSSAYIF